MNILVAFNDNYAMPTRVMLKSLIENNHEIINVYVLYVSLTDDSKNDLSTLNTDRSILHFIQIDDHILDKVPFTRFYSAEANIRLFAQLYLPEEVDRVLWLDSDVIVNGGIGEFYQQSFDGKLYVAYKDPIQGDSAEKKASLGMPADAIYINSGVLLINLEELRKRINTEDILNYINAYYSRLDFVDQDVLSGLLYDSIKVLEGEYTYNYFVSNITLQNRRKVYRNVRIIHYAMDRKPWKKGFIFYGFHLWWKYALMVDKSYRKKYRSLNNSYVYIRSKYQILTAMQNRHPKLYSTLRNFKRRITGRKDSQ